MTVDPDRVTAQELVAHAGWVTALARSLVADSWAADDVGQDTWISALQRPPRSRVNLRAWLARIVRRRHTDHFRADERRRRALAELPRKGPAEPPDEVLLKAETRLRVAQALLALEEPYRTSLLLRFHEDLAPRHIAARLGVPVATVRTRIQRGLGRLRARLEAGGERSERRRALALVAGSSGLASWAGGLGGRLAVKWACAGALALSVGALAYRGLGSESREPQFKVRAASRASTVTSPSGRGPTLVGAPKLAARGTTRSPSEALVGQAVLWGTLRRAEDGEPLGPTTLGLRLGQDEMSAGQRVQTEVDAQGRFEVTVELKEQESVWSAWLPPEDKRLLRDFVRADRAEGQPASLVRPGESVEFKVDAASLSTLSGVVVDEDGRPRAHVCVGVSLPGPCGTMLGTFLRGSTDSEGRFEVPVVADPALFRENADATARVHLSTIEQIPLPTLDIDIRKVPRAERDRLRIMMPSGRRVQGRLVDPDGHPLAGGLVIATLTSLEDARCVTTDADGAFTLDRLADGPARFGAFLPGLDLEARIDLVLDVDHKDLVLTAKPIEAEPDARTHVVMGLRLADATEDLRRRYDLTPRVGVVVIDAGVVGPLFNSAMKAGMGILAVGERSVGSVREVVEASLAAYEHPSLGAQPGGPIRLVVTAGSPPWGTNTTLFSLNASMAEHLRRTLARWR